MAFGSSIQRAVDGAETVTLWLARHWLALANSAFLLALLGAMAVPTMRWGGLHEPADLLFRAYQLVCHQQPERSFFLLGYPMAFCQRDVATYGSLALAGLLFARFRGTISPLPWRWYLLSLVPMGIDGLTQLFGLRESCWELRLLTGGLFGITTAWLAYPYLDRFSKAVLETQP